MGITEDFMNGVQNIVKRNWFSRLVDMKDTTVSASSVFMIVLTIIGCILLLVPAIALLVEVFYNHTITTDLSGMAAYITAVAAIFTSAGITKAWSTWTSYKYNAKQINEKPINFEFEEVTE